MKLYLGLLHDCSLPYPLQCNWGGADLEGVVGVGQSPYLWSYLIYKNVPIFWSVIQLVQNMKTFCCVKRSQPLYLLTKHRSGNTSVFVRQRRLNITIIIAASYYVAKSHQVKEMAAILLKILWIWKISFCYSKFQATKPNNTNCHCRSFTIHCGKYNWISSVWCVCRLLVCNVVQFGAK